MQIGFIDILYGILISGIAVMLIKKSKKKHMFKDRKCISFKKQVEDYSIINNHIDENVVRELYELIEKYFKVKTCYLSPNDKMKIFHDLSSFDLHENYEDFISHMDKEFKSVIKPEDELIDLMIKIQSYRVVYHSLS